MKTTNPVVWFEIYVDNMDRAKKFYETVLALELTLMQNPDQGKNANMQMMSFPMSQESMNTASGALVKMEGFKAGGSGTIVYFTSDDCAREEARISAAGGQVHQSKMSIGEYGYIVLGADTEGNMFGVHSIN